MVEINEQCQYRVYGDRGQSWQCQKKAVVERDGKFYCKIHSPEYIAEKKRKWNESYDRERAENEKRWHRKEVIREVCEPFTTEWLEANASVLKASKDMYEALKALTYSLTQGAMDKYDLEDAKKAIAKAEGK